jgi:hypothetical protein
VERFIDEQGPIEEFTWGRFVVFGEAHSDRGEGVGKDIRLMDGFVTEWKERKGHTLQPEMVTEVFESGIKTLIIGIGVDSAVKVPPETKQYIHDQGISELKLLPTPEACKKYNSLVREGKKVALLAHGTC